MSAETLFIIIVALIILDFLIDKILDSLNAGHYNDPVPGILKDVFNNEEYEKSQQYKKTNYRFDLLTSTFSFVVLLLFLFLDGFDYVDGIARSLFDNPILIGLTFFGIIMFASDLLSLPFSYYATFVIEERFGFN